LTKETKWVRERRKRARSESGKRKTLSRYLSEVTSARPLGKEKSNAGGGGGWDLLKGVARPVEAQKNFKKGARARALKREKREDFRERMKLFKEKRFKEAESGGSLSGWFPTGGTGEQTR